MELVYRCHNAEAKVCENPFPFLKFAAIIC